MTDMRTAAQQALEFCELLVWYDVAMTEYVEEQRERVEAALRAALAQEEHDTDCHMQGICQRSGYSIGQTKQDVPEADFGNMAQQEPVASIYVTVGGAREFDDWRCPLPVGRNLLYTTTPPARKPLSQEQIKGAVIDDPFGGAALMSMMRDGVMVGELLQAIERIARAVERAHGIGGSDE